MANLFGGILTLVLGVVLIAELVVPTIKNTTTGGWSAGEIAMWGMISLVSIMGLVYGAGAIFGLF